MKKLFLAFVFVFIGCDNTPRRPPEPPKVVIKKIVTKFQEQYTVEKLDGVALFFDSRFRTVPKLKTRYRLYAEDGSYVEVIASLFAKTKEGSEIQAVESDWKSEE